MNINDRKNEKKRKLQDFKDYFFWYEKHKIKNIF